MNILEKQKHISHQFPMAVDVADESSRVTDVSAEATTFIIASTNVASAGEAAGTVIYGRLTNSGVLDAMKARIGYAGNSSFSFGTGTVLTTHRNVGYQQMEDAYNTYKSLNEIAVAVTNGFANGEFHLDHRTGVYFGKKATTGNSDTASYSYRTTVMSSSAASSTVATVAASGTPTLSNVSVLASNFTVLSSNSNRKSAIIVNDGSANVFIKFGATATTSSFTYKLTANATLAIPEASSPIYTGIIDAIGDAATGTLRVTEII